MCAWLDCHIIPVQMFDDRGNSPHNHTDDRGNSP